MRKKRVKKHVTDINFNSESLKDVNIHIKQFLKSVLPQIGLKPGVDFWVTCNYLKIRHIKKVTGKIVIMLKEAFPVFNFYWETPRILVWF